MRLAIAFGNKMVQKSDNSRCGYWGHGPTAH